jgi:hypothetical protein
MKTDDELKENFTVELSGQIIKMTVLYQEVDIQQSKRVAQLVQKTVWDILDQDTAKTFYFLVDFTNLKSLIKFPDESSKIYTEIAAHPRIKKLAFIHHDSYVKTLINFVAHIAGKGKKMRCFSEMDEAEKWLNS